MSPNRPSIHELRVEAMAGLKQAHLDDVSFVGKKPWMERRLSKGEFLAGALGVAFGLSTLLWSAPVSVGAMISAPAAHANFMAASAKEMGKLAISAASGALAMPAFDAVAVLKQAYPNVSLEKMTDRRTVSRAFLGQNNFIALASEMEGFSGGLYKDPATGLNIGFGYNITKRIGENGLQDVKKDLLSLNIPEDAVINILALAQQPQRKLAQGISFFNHQWKIKTGKNPEEIIDITKGVALLARTEAEYRGEAQAAFANSFDRMGENQQQVLTYIAYKVGGTTLSEYKHTIKQAAQVFNKPKYSVDDVRAVAQGLTFFYSQDGQQKVFDDRAILISNTFVNQEYLAVQIGKMDAVHTSYSKLMAKKLDFSKYMPAPLPVSAPIDGSAKPGIPPEITPVIAAPASTSVPQESSMRDGSRRSMNTRG